MAKAAEKSMFSFGASNLLEDGVNAEGNFHIKKKEEVYNKATTEGHFSPLFRRVEKINQSLDDIINY